MSRRSPYPVEPPQTDESGAAVFWRSLEEKNDPESLQKAKQAEFPLGVGPTTDVLAASARSRRASSAEIEDGIDSLDKVPFDRRSFIKFGTAVTALFGLDGCIRRPVEKLVPYTRTPENTVPGISEYFATVTSRRGEAIGLLVESHENRPTKIEGNPEHPASRGGTDLITQASIFDLYDPDRSTTPSKGAPPANAGAEPGRAANEATWEEFEKSFDALLTAHDGDKGAKLRVLMEPTLSPTILRVRKDVLARFPNARFHTWAPLSDDNAIEGAKLALGQAVAPIVEFDRARVILALDSDFLQTESGCVRANKTFARGRRLRAPSDTMSRLYVVEPTHTTTGSNADHRLRLPAGDVERYARALTKELATEGLDLKGLTADAPPDGIPEKWLKAVAKDLLANRGRAVIVVGSRQPARVHALACALNAALGAVGPLVTYVPVVDPDAASPTQDLKALAQDLEAGKVDTLVILGGNPLFDAPADLKLAAKIAKAKTSIHLASHVDETSAVTSWHLPRTHELEAWGDLRSIDGTWSIQQPLIAPLHGGRSDLEILARMLPEKKSAFELVRDTVKATLDAGLGFETTWKRALKRGFVGDRMPLRPPTMTPGDVKSADIGAELAKVPPKKSAGLEIVFSPCPKLFDGRHANNPWLLELPDPMTKIVWENVALISPNTAKDLGLKSGDLVEVTREGARVELPAWIQPGQADGTIGLTLGWGRERAGRYGSKKGFDVYPLRTSDALGFGEGAAKATGRAWRDRANLTLTQTQDHQSMEGRPLAIDTTLDDYRAEPTFVAYKSPNPRILPLWPRVDYSQVQKWGMNIDLNSCTGCNACVIACQSENNIPVVGKEQVGHGREMYWIRIDRYFMGKNESDPQVAYQPVACVQCEEAPCENVCPVNATEHSPEGLNDMAYNRCIGTRYCANNCPYKVRRFNFLEFNGAFVGDENATVVDKAKSTYGTMPETQKMLFNPNVTVRFRGVMEKCTYCVQRIQEAKIHARRAGSRTVKEGGVNTACAQACPADAITFGDLNDPKARVAELAKRDRSYTLLAELGTHPRTTYLGKVRNPNKEMA
jgi:molybdopterin-containing oxidoreductase family iron-sulfur binding subunit